MEKKVGLGEICLGTGFALTIVLLTVALVSRRFDPIIEVIFQPYAYIIENGPGGQEDPFLHLVAFPAQVALYAGMLYVVPAVVSRIRRGPPNKNLSIQPK
jgi:hypothetical protein